MAGFLGGSSSGGAGGEITFPTEFIDPVTKLRVSEPETLIDTDFEYGLQPTKWETVELINNTPSFFSKSGDTTINGILAMVTTATSREIKVTTADPHGLAVGIPINVSGTKSITADGSYIINSIPDSRTFTYLAKQNQDFTASIFDLYTSIITGEFFQGSQIKISDSQGIVTNAAAPSVLTVQTDSPHGFQVGTPFYFLNLNSTVSQQFDASNTGAKTFDSSNSATAQSFDGSNTLTSYSINLNNKGLIGGVSSASQTFSAANKTITVLHSSEGFAGKKIGTPIYHNVLAASGYFNTYPRGIVFLADNTYNSLGTASATSTFSVSATPGGTPLDIPSYPNGTFQLANNSYWFAGNNLDTTDPLTVALTTDSPKLIDGANATGSIGTVNTYSGTIIQINNDAGSTISPDLYIGAMVFYTTTGTAASGLTNNTTYWVTYYNEPAGASVPGFFQIKVSATVGGADISISGGTGTQKFRKIGVSLDKDIFHIRNHGFVAKDMVQYTYPVGGAMTVASSTTDYYYVSTVFDVHNFDLSLTRGITISASTGATQIVTAGGYTYAIFKSVSGTKNITFSGDGEIELLVVAGGGGGGWDVGSGGGAGGLYYRVNHPVVGGTSYNITVGAGGTGCNPVAGTQLSAAARTGSDSTFGATTAKGGGGSGTYNNISAGAGGSGGGGIGTSGNTAGGAATQPSTTPTYGFGFPGGTGVAMDGANNYSGYAGGGGAGGPGGNGSSNWTTQGDSVNGCGGIGKEISAFASYGGDLDFPGWFAGGGGASTDSPDSNPSIKGWGRGGKGGGGHGTNGLSRNGTATGGQYFIFGKNNTGGGGGGGGNLQDNPWDNVLYGSGNGNSGGPGGSGVVMLRFQG
jgi:hypothetical protein